MDLLIVVLWLALLGCLTWVIVTHIPMEPIFRVLIYVIVAVALCVYVLRRFSGVVPNILN